MKINCPQMEVLISFYLENELSPALKAQVEEHLSTCKNCHAKFEIIKSMLNDLKDSVKTINDYKTVYHNNESEQYKVFKENLSAYLDNELEGNETLQVKKFAINNSNARKDLENSYAVRRLIKNSMDRTKNEFKQDFTRSILKQLEVEEENSLNFNPAIKFLIVFTISVLVLTTIVLVSLSI